MTAECESFSAVYSGFVNADSGYVHYAAFGASEWASRVDAASAELAALASASVTALAEPLSRMHTAVTGTEKTVGASLAGSEGPLAEIQQACDTNHTPIHVMAEFGG